MTKEELINIRDEYALKITKVSKIKKPFGIISILVLIAFFIMYIVNVSVHSNYFNLGETLPSSYNITLIISFIVLGIGIILLVLFVFFFFKEKSYQKKRDEASFKLTGLAFEKEIKEN